MARTFRKEIKKPDIFHRLGDQAVEWYLENRKVVIIAAAGILLVVLGVAGYRLWASHIRSQAALSLATADIVSEDPLSPEIEKALRRTAEKYPSTRSGVIARLRLAGLMKDRGDGTSAEKEFRDMLKAGALSGTDQELARRGLAGSLAIQGKCGEAVPIWREILTRGSLLTPEDIYLSIGDCNEKDGKTAEALKVYEELIQKHPGSPFITPDIRARVSRLGGK